MNLREIKRTLRLLTPEQLERLDAWLHELINREPTGRERAKERHEESGKTRTMTKTYRLERVRCGSKKCRCASGELHGPYWYAYWSEGGRTRSQYIGKKLPAQKKRR
jgi:hypothetical protein